MARHRTLGGVPLQQGDRGLAPCNTILDHQDNGWCSQMLSIEAPRVQETLFWSVYWWLESLGSMSQEQQIRVGIT